VSPISGERSCLAIRIGWHGAASRARRTCCSHLAPARRWAPESGVRDGEFLVALEVAQRTQSAVVRIASLVDRDWLAADCVRGRAPIRQGERQGPRGPRRPLRRADARRASGAGRSRDRGAAARRRLARSRSARRRHGAAAAPALSPARTSISRRSCALPHTASARSARCASTARWLQTSCARSSATRRPRSPSRGGRHTPLTSNEDGSVSASVKLQELFGLADTPRVGRQREPVVLSLLAPNGRPSQVTRDLRSFWDRTYPEVRKEWRGRYPKHPWRKTRGPHRRPRARSARSSEAQERVTKLRDVGRVLWDPARGSSRRVRKDRLHVILKLTPVVLSLEFGSRKSPNRRLTRRDA